MSSPVYVDHAATSPMRAEAIAIWNDTHQQIGNASSVHQAGRTMRGYVEESREKIAGLLGAHPSEILFTSGGTESDNLAIIGLAWARRRKTGAKIVLCSALEHSAVLAAAKSLISDGFTVEMLPSTSTGHILPESVAAAIGKHSPENIALLTVMAANNETGIIQDLPAIGAIATRHEVPFHTDAVASGPHSPDFSTSGADTMAFSGHKFGGPLGTGLLLVSRSAQIRPLMHGGGQERGLRPGSLNVPGIRSLAVALTAACQQGKAEEKHKNQLCAQLLAGIAAIDPEIELTGSGRIGDYVHNPEKAAIALAGRLPGTLHLCIPHADAEGLMVILDRAQISASTGSACAAGVHQASHVLDAMGLPENLSRGALRFSLGRTNTAAEIRHIIATMPAAITAARAAQGSQT